MCRTNKGLWIIEAEDEVDNGEITAEIGTEDRTNGRVLEKKCRFWKGLKCHNNTYIPRQ